MSGDKKICPTCYGNGYIMDSDGEQFAAIDCPTCDSQGVIVRPVIHRVSYQSQGKS